MQFSTHSIGFASGKRNMRHPALSNTSSLPKWCAAQLLHGWKPLTWNGAAGKASIATRSRRSEGLPCWRPPSPCPLRCVGPVCARGRRAEAPGRLSPLGVGVVF